MIGRTNVGGGGTGAGNAIAYIGVSYAAGATVTCTKGTKTLRAKDTTGLYVFPIPEIGVWTITAVNGSITQSKSVEITTLWQDEIVDLAFWDGTLFDNGNQYVDYTGGWAYNGNLKWDTFYTTSQNRATINTKIQIGDPGSSSMCGVQNLTRVDLTNYSSLQVQVDSLAMISGLPTGAFVITNTANGKIGGSNDTVFRPDSTGLKTYDISGISGNRFVTVVTLGSGAGMTVSKLKLNKS